MTNQERIKQIDETINALELAQEIISEQNAMIDLLKIKNAYLLAQNANSFPRLTFIRYPYFNLS